MRGVILGLMASLLAAPALAQTSASSWPGDAARVEMIERVSRSVVHLKGVRERPPVPNYLDLLPAKERERILKRDPGIEQRMGRQGKTPPERQEGSGFVIDSARGIVLTAHHMLAGSTSISAVLPDGSERALKLLGKDEPTGIAVYRIEGAPVPALTIATRKPRAGESAMIVGRAIPLGATLASQGMVMGQAGEYSEDRTNSPALLDYLALDSLLVNAGMGGGPVVNMRGEAIGIASAIYGRREDYRAMTMAVPLSDLQTVIEQLISKGKVTRGQIGVSVDCQQRVCTVMGIAPDGPADKAGIKSGDVIKSFGGKVVSTNTGLQRLVAATPVGASVGVVAFRDGRDVPVMVTLAVISEAALDALDAAAEAAGAAEDAP